MISLIALLVVARWATRSAVEQAISNYFQQKLATLPKTQITYDIAAMQIAWWKHNIALQDVTLMIQHEKNTSDTATYHLTFPQFNIDIRSLWDLVSKHTLDIEEISLKQPQIQVFLPPAQDSVILQQEVGNLQQETLWFLKQLNVTHFELLNGSLQLSVGGVPEPRYSLGDVSVYMDNLDIDVDSLSASHVTELLLTENIQVILKNEAVLLPDEQHTLHFKELHISSKDDAILIDSLHLYAADDTELSKNQDTNNNIKIPQLHLKGIDFLSLYLDNKLFIDTVFVGKTDLNLLVDENSVTVFKPSEKQKKYSLDSVHISQLHMMPGTITVRHTTDSLTDSYKIDSATLVLGDVTHSPKDSSFSWDAQKLELQLKNYQSKLADKHYNFSFEKLNWTLTDKSFGLEGVMILPEHDTIPLATERPLKYLKIPSFTIKQMDFTDLFFKKQLSGESIEIESPTLGFVLPGHAATHKKEPVNVGNILKQFFKTFKLEKLSLNNGNIALFHNHGPAFFTLENINVYGHEWELAENEQIAEAFPLEVSFEKGQLLLPDFHVSLSNTHYSNIEDQLIARQIDVQPSGEKEGLQASVQLSDVTLGGLQSMQSVNQLGLVSIRKIKANIILPENKQKKANTNNAPQLFRVDALQIDQLDAEIEMPGMGSFTLQNLKADLKEVALGDPSFPFVFNFDDSQLHLGSTSFALQHQSGGFDSLRLQTGNMDFYNIAAASDSASQAQWQVTLPQLEIDHLQFPDEENTSLHIGQVALRQPSASGMLPVQHNDTTSNDKDNDTPSSASSFQVLLDTLLVDQAQWSLGQAEAVHEDTTFWSANSLTVKGYQLQYPLANDELLSQNIWLELDSLQQKSSNTQWLVEKIEASMKEQTVALQNIQLQTQTATANIPALQVAASLAGIQLKTNNVQGWNLAQPWLIEELIVQHPELSVSWDSISETSTMEKKPKSEPSFPMPSVAVKSFHIEQANLKTQGMDEQPNLSVEGLDFNLQDLFWNTQDSLNPMALLKASDWEIKIAHPQVNFPDPPAQANLYGLHFQNRTADLQWDSVQYAPTVGPFEFSEYLTHQKPWLSVTTGPGVVQDLQWEEAANGSFVAKKIQIRQPNVTVFRDKRLPFPENHHPPMLHEMLVKSPSPVFIDTIELHDGYIDVRIQPEQGEKVGQIHFSNVESIISNVTNIPARIQEDDVMRSTSYVKIQDAGLAKAHIDYDLDDPYFTFFMDVTVGKMDLRKLNPITEPVASVRIKSGRLRKIELKAIAHDEFAYGNMDLMYRKLRLSLLSKKDHEHQGVGLAIESFLANNLILRRNNDHPFPHRQGHVFVERDDTRQVFNYWGQIAVSGILTSAGVKSNRKALKKQFDRKRKQLEEEMKDTTQVASEFE